MKKTNLFSKLFLGAAVVTLSLGAVSCKEENKAPDTEEAAEDANEAKFDDTASDSLEDDSEYLVKAAEIDLTEIELGKLAQEKGSLAQVKDFGKMMADMHTKSYDALKATASQKNITIPMSITEDGKQKWDDLNKKTGHDFDKAYADAMVDGHEKAIKEFEDASNNAKDPDIKTWATNMLPDLRTHLTKAKEVKAAVDAVK